MAITLNQAILKIVITLKSTFTENQIRNYLINTVWPKLETKIDTKMDNNFNTGWSKQVKLKVHKTADDWVDIYPKFTISGTTSLTGAQLKTGVSDLLRDLKTTLKDEFESQGATDITFHPHYQDGRAKEADET